MSKYGVGIDKVEIMFKEVLKTGDNQKIAEFAQEVIPLLIADTKRARMEVTSLFLKGRI